MPTARPSIVARIGAVSDRSMTPDSAVTPAMPIATPMIAVISGIPAASSEASVIARTTKAIIMPALSEPASFASVTRPPPNSTFMPGVCGGLGDSPRARRGRASSISAAGTG